MENEIITKLKYICEDEYAKNSSLISLYRDIIEHNNFIHNNTTEYLWQNLCIELDYVYNELYLGYGVYSEYVFNNCINVLKKIVRNL
jgi:hypothetical protein